MPLSADTPPPAVTPAPPDPGVASLYQEIILSHYRAPRHKGVLAGADAAVEHRNPLCGDVISVQLRLDGDTIADAAFTARACSITQATASMLLTRIIGGTVRDAVASVTRIEQLVETGTPTTEVEAAELGDLRALASVARFPARKACVRLVTAAVSDALQAG
ncbi:MAG TPA: SUF system NifU family Fe-S cluster assembly protein [Gemmatimonadaceae bacterium]|nr:SUF system NifU family Fe-S cluster assembly protein [Gemmatimonadaceae bacterium]